MAKFLVLEQGSWVEPVELQAKSIEDLLTSQGFIEFLEECDEDSLADDENPLDHFTDLRIYDENFQLQKLPNKKLVRTFVLEDV